LRPKGRGCISISSFKQENIEAIKDGNHKVTKEKGHEGIITQSKSITNINAAVGRMKIAFEPMGQHKLRPGIDKVLEWKAKRGQLVREPKFWPYKVLSFEVWAEATSSLLLVMYYLDTYSNQLTGDATNNLVLDGLLQG
jgi:hypothetical protein